MTKAVKPDIPSEMISLKEALEQRYLAYALSTITNRALPDVRDGLKPVHRRLLYAMRQLRLDPENGFKKSARVVGDVIGRYHPHGDQSVYDALVRLAQDFAVRYPLVDGQGNFGNIDGDNAAAMRYTEARMTRVAQLLLQDIDQGTVEFRDTYDGEDEEPLVFPSAFPNLLANGSSGIAVGMATNIPPHNADELLAASLHLIKSRQARNETLMEYVKGPDFPTGGICVEPPEAIAQAYATGRGSFRLRAKYEVETLPRGQWQIVVTEIPYQVQKSRLIERIAELMQNRSLPMLEDVRDESAEDVRLVLDPKNKEMDPAHLMAALFKVTELETRISLNMNVLDAQGVPRVMGLREVLLSWLDHRKDVLIRKSKNRVEKLDARLEILAGYLIAYLNLDEVIRIIRQEDEPRDLLMTTFDLTQNQADAILNMRLRALRKLEEDGIRREHKDLSKERASLKELLASDELQWKTISNDIKDLRKEFGPKTELGRRRTLMSAAPVLEDVSLDMFVAKEPVTIVCSDKGWIRSMKGHIENGASLTYKSGDKAGFVLHAQSTDKLVLFASNGRFYILEAGKLPGGRGNGEPVRLMLDIDPSEEIVEIFPHEPKRKLLVASRIGNGFVVSEDEVLNSRRAGKQVLNVKAPDEAAVCVPAGGDYVAVLGENRKLLCFKLADVPEMTRGKGVRLQRHGDGHLSDVRVYFEKQGLSVSDKSGRSRVFEDLKDFYGLRAQAGKVRPKGFPADGLMGAAFPNRL